MKDKGDAPEPATSVVSSCNSPHSSNIETQSQIRRYELRFPLSCSHSDIPHPTFFQITQGIQDDLSSCGEEVRIVYPTLRELAHTDLKARAGQVKDTP